jgi:hypothetical protein
MTSHESLTRPLNQEEERLVREIAGGFSLGGEVRELGCLETGLINLTYVLTVSDGEGGRVRYLLQRINEKVFTDPAAVMRNVELVTTHINDKVLRKRKDLGGQTLSLFAGRDGQFFVKGPHGGTWRCYNFIEGCNTYDVVENSLQAYEAGRAFGAFQDLVSDLSPDSLAETIPDFHNTRKRFEQFNAAVERDREGRLKEISDELEFVHANEEWVDRLSALQKEEIVPLRITHNDTKINNVMFDVATDRAVCVIDLDTVMPGLSLYDFGDLVRTATNPAEEDERDLSKVAMRDEIFSALVRGYLETAGGVLTEGEIANLAFSGKLIAFELGMRFLTDHLEGDRYFKIQREGQNLDRARCQFRLAQCIAEKEGAMNAMVREVVASTAPSLEPIPAGGVEVA